jgi:hypothetical protein
MWDNNEEDNGLREEIDGFSNMLCPYMTLNAAVIYLHTGFFETSCREGERRGERGDG